MVNSIYDEAREISREVLAEFSQGSVSYIEMAPGNGPAHNPGDPVEKPYALDGAAKGVSFKYIDATQIVAGDFQIVTATRDDVKPSAIGFIRADGIRYKIKRVDNIPPVGVTVAHRIFYGK